MSHRPRPASLAAVLALLLLGGCGGGTIDSHGRDAAAASDGQPVTSLTLADRDGILLVRE